MMTSVWVIVFVDGFDFAGHTMIGALGVTAEGIKVPLGVVQGSTENATVVSELITSLRDRGLDASEGTLFVLDGGKALAKGVPSFLAILIFGVFGWGWQGP